MLSGVTFRVHEESNLIVATNGAITLEKLKVVLLNATITNSTEKTQIRELNTNPNQGVFVCRLFVAY